MPETNEAVVVAPQANENGEVVVEQKDGEQVILSKEEYAKLNATIGSMKRELKDFQKSKDTAKDAPTPEANDLLPKAYLAARGVTADDEVELALSTAKKWGMGVDQLVNDADWQTKLDKHRTTKANVEATSQVKGSGASSQANQTPEYWIAKGTPPTPDQVPDRKTRATIAKAMMGSAKDGKKFYNE